MDTSKWKSVAVKIEDYRVLRELSDKNFRAPAGTISFLLHEYQKNNQRFLQLKTLNQNPICLKK